MIINVIKYSITVTYWDSQFYVHPNHPISPNHVFHLTSRRCSLVPGLTFDPLGLDPWSWGIHTTYGRIWLEKMLIIHDNSWVGRWCPIFSSQSHLFMGLDWAWKCARDRTFIVQSQSRNCTISSTCRGSRVIALSLTWLMHLQGLG